MGKNQITSQTNLGLDRIQIAFLTLNDPLDKRSWSGTTYYIGQTLDKYIGKVDFIGPVKFPWLITKIFGALSKITRVVFAKEYVVKYSLLLSWYAGRQMKKKMKGKQYDCIVVSASSNVLCFLKSKAPIIYISDTTFHQIINYYHDEFSNVSSLSKFEGNYLERTCLHKSDLLIYSSVWAASSAITDYLVTEKKIAIMPFGANMDYVPDRSMIFSKMDNTRLSLLFLAVDWERKGGSIAFETLQILHARGIDAKLIVCGCTPPASIQHKAMEVIPFLNKNVKADHDRFISLLSSVHFLILPTRADCSLLVACESNSYGVPAITTDTGGVPDVVINGVNGYCLPYEARGNEYADIISDIYSDKEKYSAMILSSRMKFEEKLNWEKWAERFKELYSLHIQKNVAASN